MCSNKDTKREAIRGRVITEHKASYVVSADGEQYEAAVRGSFHGAKNTDFPKVGDYVMMQLIDDGKVVIESVENRHSVLTRKSAHDDTQQVMVANVDVVFIVMGLTEDYNLRRLERYLQLANQARVRPVVILNKQDIASEVEEKVAAVAALDPTLSVHTISAKEAIGMEVFAEYLPAGTTGVLLGSSGAGKSTITNFLLSQAQQTTQDTRTGDGKGKHTTTTRELFVLASGGALIDTPGMRELGFMTDDDLAHGAFADIERLAHDCRFSNCDHIKSAGCAVQAAIAAGELEAKRFQNYLKLQAKQAETRNTRRRD